MYKLCLILFLVSTHSLSAQKGIYTTANGHSHNDYERPNPFYEAYRHQFGSIEADIFLLKDSRELYVAHTSSDLNRKRRTLDSLYLLPLVNGIRKNNGSVYPDSTRKLQLLVDIKTEAIPTLNRLIEVLRQYPALINTSSLRIVISGNRPTPDSFSTYPSFIHFDGVLGTTYSKEALKRIPLLSASFRQFSNWNGIGTIPGNERAQLSKLISDTHYLGKPVRLWAAPDTIDTWKELMNLNADYINTDRVKELSDFFKSLQ
ncbi:MAG: phosphatidylinositol-specific phospholipase C/glycerophosphodiester phosphodiesterase family protein [Flavitalea sp.]